MKQLPNKYYLTHFHEFLTFIQGPCSHLLDKDDNAFIQRFYQMQEDAQCLFVRGLNRKSALIKRSSLYYAEIDNHDTHLLTLIKQCFYAYPEENDFSDLLLVLTKAELIQLLKDAQVAFKVSAKKELLYDLAMQYCNFTNLVSCGLTQPFIKRSFDQQIQYLLFLFFGDLYSGLNKFSMRDMGIMQTKQDVSMDMARFEFMDEAKSAFFYALKRRQVSQFATDELCECAKTLKANIIPVGTIAITHFDKFLFKLGKRLLPIDHELAIEALSLSAEPEAQERVIREKYKQGKKDWVLRALQSIIDYPESEGLLAFAEDFLARKYQQKRTSILTDMLRQKSKLVHIDEIYRDQVETGVKRFYQINGAQAFKTENRLWRALFGIVFWYELFEIDDKALITEFDYKPQALIQNNFYEVYQHQIESRLNAITSTKLAFKQISKTVIENYGKTNGIFRWHKSLLEVLAVFFDHVEIDSVTKQLLAMAKDFKTLSDGYPDLMVVENKILRFEEVKAPGDQLRKNQLITIRQLRKNGFDVSVTQVEWFLDPQQAYCVVDIETTGGGANNHRITEIGIVKVIGDKIVDRWETLLNPQRHIPRIITQLTGIDDAMVVDAPLFAEVAESLSKFLADSVFVAHNVNFDYGFIRNEFERIDRGFRMPKLCTVREMRKARPGLKSYSLANLTEYFGIDMTKHHRAMSDAMAAAELLFIINDFRTEN